MSKGMDVYWTNNSFKQLLPSLCSTDCSNRMNESLFLVGEIGGDDYNHAFFQGRSVDEIKTFVPDVVSAIGSAIENHDRSGNFLIGCIAIYLTRFQSDKREDYESETGASVG
ncbi:lipid catabolic process [Musa troglodytarum]|uniref:Lipid catabolic process n=1 Tax=Musa troglodytarum TaxID=320322 RepID=A0A9E7K998_9LILI|nr:lipid catabolic process [Musa troglodytarum]